jgi:RNA polymerase sigma factor (sigma-70 family)
MVNVDVEQELIRGFLAGESQAFTTVNSWINNVLNLRGWHHSIREARDDTRQEVLIALTENFRNNKYKGKGLKTYVSSVTKFTCLKAFDRRTVVDIEDQNLTNKNPSALEDLIEDENYASIKDALWKLNDKCRKLLALRFFRDLDHNRIAGTLKITTVASRQWLKRCLDKLRELVYREDSL